jgi:hypothetical protein
MVHSHYNVHFNVLLATDWGQPLTQFFISTG